MQWKGVARFVVDLVFIVMITIALVSLQSSHWGHTGYGYTSVQGLFRQILLAVLLGLANGIVHSTASGLEYSRPSDVNVIYNIIILALCLAMR